MGTRKGDWRLSAYVLPFRHVAEEKKWACLRMDLAEVSAQQVADGLRVF